MKGMLEIMKNSLKAYVDGLFSDTPMIPAVTELHDEILSNLEARYDDCINAGMSPQRAYTAVIGTMGDIAPLISQVSGTGVHEEGIFEKASPKSRLLQKYSYVFTDENVKSIKGAAIALLWIGITILFFLAGFYGGEFDTAWLIFILGAAITVGISMGSKIIKLSKGGDTPEIRIKMLKTIRGGASAIMWLLVVIIYFVFNLGGYYWDISWLIFLVAAMVQIVLNLIFKIQINRYKNEM